MNTMFFSPSKANRRMNTFFNPSVIDSIFNDVLNGTGGEAAARIPSTNILEDENKFTLELVAPGFEKEEITIDLEDSRLKISGEKKVEETETKKNYTRREFKSEKFSRSFTLPENVNSDEIKAEFKNGILFIEIPKKAEEKKTKQIVIE
jgi:HSP20 family protein